MQQSRDTASASVGEMLKLCQRFMSQETKEHINNEISPSVSRILATFTTQPRFTTTMSIFMYFFLEVSKCVALLALSGGLQFSEEDCWDFFAENMAPFTTSSTSVPEMVLFESSVSSEKMVQAFLRDLAGYMQTVKTTKKYLVSLHVF